MAEGSGADLGRGRPRRFRRRGLVRGHAV